MLDLELSMDFITLGKQDWPGVKQTSNDTGTAAIETFGVEENGMFSIKSG